MGSSPTDIVELWLTDEQRARMKKEAGISQKVWRMSLAHLAATAMLARHQGTDVLLLGPGATNPVFGRTTKAERPSRLIRLAFSEEQQAQIFSLVGMRASAVEFGLDDGDVSFREDWKKQGQLERIECKSDTEDKRTFVILRGEGEYETAEGELLIRLPLGTGSEASVFGTGSHGTTRCSLRLLERHMKPGMRVLDVGTGSGILSLAAARLGAREVHAIDISDEAVAAAKDTFAAGGIADIAIAEQRNNLEELRGFDLLVGNLFTNIVLRMVEEMKATVIPGGIIIVSGFVTARAEEVETAFLEKGLELAGQTEDDGWEARVFRVP